MLISSWGSDARQSYSGLWRWRVRCWPEDADHEDARKEARACRELVWVALLLALAYVAGLVYMVVAS